MTMLVELPDVADAFSQIQGKLDGLCEQLDVQITMQREEVFRFMYRL